MKTAQFGYLNDGQGSAGAYQPDDHLYDGEPMYEPAEHQYAALGAFDGGAGLPADGAALNGLRDFDAYVDLLLAKASEITATPVVIEMTDVSERYVALGGSANDLIYYENDYSHYSYEPTGFICGREGDDYVIFYYGTATVAPGVGDDRIYGMMGDNTISYFDVPSGVVARAQHSNSGGQDTGVGIKEINGWFENLIGSDHNDTLSGDDVANRLDGGLGADTLSGLEGDDALTGGAGVDRVLGGAGDDLLTSAGDGDFLNGGEGADRFVFTAFGPSAAGAVSTVAVIHDLDAADRVDLRAVAAGFGGSFVVPQGHFDGHAGEARATWKAAKDVTVIKFDMDGDAKADHRLIVQHGDYTDFTHFMGVHPAATAETFIDSGDLVV